MQRYRKTVLVSRRAIRDDGPQTNCPFPFCKPDNTQKILFENKTMYVMTNRVPYDMFEGRRVIDHLMVIPKRHVGTINDFTDQEKIDQMTVMGDYESRGYNVYARGTESVSRSVLHQHTHLIKLRNVKSKFVLFMERPYFLIDR